MLAWMMQMFLTCVTRREVRPLQLSFMSQLVTTCDELEEHGGGHEVPGGPSCPSQKTPGWY